MDASTLFACVVIAFALGVSDQGPAPFSTGEAIKSMQAGDFATASQLLHKGLPNHANDPNLWNLLGIAETELHHPALARDAFEHGLHLLPNSIELNENYGLLFYRSADYKNAQKYLERAVSLGSDKPGVRFSLAASLLRNGQVDQALSSLKLLENPLRGSPEYWEERGRAELSVEASSAGASFARALALAPNSPTALNGAATVAEKQGQDEEALSLLIKAREANPDDVATLTHFAMVCLRRDLGPDAISALERARRIDPGDRTILYLLARANISVQNWQHAHDLFLEFSHKLPSFAPTYFALGWLDIKLGRVDEARRELQHSLSLAPKLVDARYELAQLELDDGNPDKAEELIRNVLQEAPNHAKANMLMGDLLLRHGQLEQAQTYLERSIGLEPQLASAHYKLSILYFREHQTEQAEHEKKVASALTEEAAQQSKNQLKLVLPESEASH